MPNVLETARRFKNELLRNENQTSLRLIRGYEFVYRRLENNIQNLENDIQRLSLLGRLNRNEVAKLSTYGSLQNQILDEINRYGGVVDNDLRLSAQQTIETASRHTQQTVAAYFSSPQGLQAFNAGWDRLPSESIENLLGFLSDNSQLHLNLTRDLGSSAVQVFSNNLLEGVALGYNPNKIAANIRSSLGQPLSWVLSTVRTSQLYTYRESTRANYIANSNIVSGWVWLAALDGRTCLSCFSKHGQEFPNDVSLNDHHQGRCTQVPLLFSKFGIDLPQVENGEDVFNSLPESQQKQRMGEAMFRAWKNNEFQFRELSTPYQNDIYGEMLKEASLTGLLGNRAREYYD